jgi:peroxiredoxin
MKTIRIILSITLTAVLIVTGFGLGTYVFAQGSSQASRNEVSPAEVFTEETSEPVPEQTSDSTITALQSIGFKVMNEPAPARDFLLVDLEGTERSLSDYSDAYVFLNFWAGWCPPCIREMPSMQALHDTFKDDGFTVLAVNIQENAETVSTFMKENGYSFPVLLDPSGSVGKRYGIRGIPATFLIHPDGTIRAAFYGARYWDEPDVITAFETVLGL